MNELNEDELNFVNGGTNIIETSATCSVPSCPRCKCIELSFTLGLNGKMQYVCTKCTFTGSREEFPYILPPNM